MALNILHLSDLHLTARKIDNQRIVIKAFLLDLKSLREKDIDIDYLIFSGDLVNDPDENNAYDLFDVEFLQPLKSVLGIQSENIFFCPGNHDISRKLSQPLLQQIDEVRNAASDLQSLEVAFNGTLVTTYLPTRFSHYHNFVKKQKYRATDEFGIYHSKFRRTEHELQVIGVNSSLLSNGGVGAPDRGHLAICDTFLSSITSDSDNAKINIYFQHHPDDWMNEVFNSNTSKITVPKMGNAIVLTGHVHQPHLSVSLSADGKLLKIGAGALFTDRNRNNYYSIISVSPDGSHKQVLVRSYQPLRKAFDLGANVAPDGIFHPDEESKKFFSENSIENNAKSFRNWVSKIASVKLRPQLDESIASPPLSSVYVFPDLTKLEDIEADGETKAESESETKCSFLDVLAGEAESIVFFERYSGQSSFAKQLALNVLQNAIHSERPMLPIIIDAYTSQLYEAAILKSAKIFCLDIFSEKWKLERLLSDGRVFLIFENVVPTDETSLGRIKLFCSKYPKCKIVLLMRSLQGLIQFNSPRFKIFPEASRFNMRPLSRSSIRTIVEKWPLPLDFSEDWVVEHITEKLKILNLPRTGVNVSIMLTILEASRSVTPTNVSTLVENYVEVILEKQNVANAFRKDFDFKNKVDLLSAMARWMYIDNKFHRSQEEVIDFADAYFKGIGFREDPRGTVEYFVNARILILVGTEISFRFSVLQTYFAAVRMLSDNSFKDELLSSPLRYASEISMYCDLKRNSIEILNFVESIFRKQEAELCDQIDFPLKEEHLEGIDWSLGTSSKLLKRTLENETTNPRSSGKERDRKIESVSSRESVVQKLERNDVQNTIEKWFTALTLYSECIRNLDEISVDEKRRHLRLALSGWARLMAYGNSILYDLAKVGEVNFKGLRIKVVGHAPDLSTLMLVNALSLFVGHTTLELALTRLGTSKLEVVLDDESIYSSAASKLIGRTIYIRLRMHEFLSKISKTHKIVAKSDYLSSLFYLFLSSVYQRIPMTRIEEDVFRNTIVELKSSEAGDKGRRQKDMRTNLIAKKWQKLKSGFKED